MKDHKHTKQILLSLILIVTVIIVGWSNALALVGTAEYYILRANSTGEVVAGVSTDKTVHIWDALTGDVMLIFDVPIPPLAIAWSPSSDRLAVVGGDPLVRVYCVDLYEVMGCDQGNVVAVLEGHQSPLIAVDWSNDDRLITGGQYEVFSVRLWDMSNYQLVQNYLGGDTRQLHWHPNNTLIAQANLSGGAYILSGDLDPSLDRRDQRISPNDLTPVFSIAWNHDGSLLAYGDDQGVVRVIDATTRQELQVFQGTGQIYGLAWSPNGNYLASSSSDGSMNIWRMTTQGLSVQSVNTFNVDKQVAITLGIDWTSNGTLLYPSNNNLIFEVRTNSTNTPEAFGEDSNQNP
ncbi:MAG: hypothetical protein SF123_06960 [Chloroflexota bacterium]|nr:hypothetical protein [Chloroflexota bacterium]